ncbi:endothelial zinc finger protein induced by tumor necrosis factor alpha-like [Periophthalmus magnuspinnatus]|uniref:endothelial zinc finger protein induced by tumor necrosis factor alpha-like n=1 Tax=Periophthalmus magnuspinnatus TaxID=409849 RepID=UPI002436CA6A|nr:endothelial zinc finger protein induced by tumor necrosis factor alpha-like [Periophthalmus magnuspinnatus]
MSHMSHMSHMSRAQSLRALVSARLSAAAEEICALLERTVEEYEHELSRVRETRGHGTPGTGHGTPGTGHGTPGTGHGTPGTGHGTPGTGAEEQREPRGVRGVQIVSVSEEALEQSAPWNCPWKLQPEEGGPCGSGNQTVKPDHVKDEPELCIKQEEQLPFTPVTVKSEDDEDKSSVLHQRPTEENREETNGEECGADQRPYSCSDQRPYSCSVPLTLLQSLVKKPKPRRHRCSDCGKSFVRNAELQRHMLIHTGQRPFGCSVCGRGFRVVYQLHSHMRTHTGEKSCFCQVCNKGFGTKSLLKEHMRVHTGHKPFRCPVCNRGFTQRGNVRAHIRTHTGEKPFSCPVCQRSFTQKSTLDKHVATHRRKNHTGVQESPFD